MKLDLTEFHAYAAKFRNTFSPPTRVEIMTQVGRAIGKTAVRYAADYPEPSGKPLPLRYSRTSVKGTVYRSKFKSRKQQGKVFALAKEGRIPYSRTGTLGKSITYRVLSVTPAAVSTEVGTNLSYAPDVIGDQQDEYFAGTWTPMSKTIANHTDQINDVAYKTAFAEIDKRLK